MRQPKSLSPDLGRGQVRGLQRLILQDQSEFHCRPLTFFLILLRVRSVGRDVGPLNWH
jgi:hypothetical protein